MFKTMNPTTVQPIDITFFGASIDAFAKNYIVYEVWRDDVLIYIGTCKFTAFAQLPDAQSNSMFMREVNGRDPLNIRIVAIGTKTDCYNDRARRARALPELPMCNKYGQTGRFTGVLCETDGKTYRSQSEAAQAYGISQGNLSSHLRGVPGHTTVSGRVFRRVAL